MSKRPRIIPILLLHNGNLVKTVKFQYPNYIGDPINAVKIFNEKDVDELVLLDISCTIQNKEPDYDLLKRISTEAFMPLAYGGGITNIDQIKRILKMGYEKIILNTSVLTNPDLITEGARMFGSQSIVVSIDSKPNLFKSYSTYIRSGTKNTHMNPIEIAKMAVEKGAGEIIINSIHKDGTMLGYDLGIIQAIAESVSVPVIACGGAGTVQDLKMALDIGKADAVSAGSMFIYYGKHKAVLITFPDEEKLFTEGIYIK